MRKLLFMLMLLYCNTLFAQKDNVLQAFKKYNVSGDVLNTDLKSNLDRYHIR